MTANEVILLVGAFGGGGALAGVITALVNRKKTVADANNVQVQSAMTLAQGMEARIANLEKRVADVEAENMRLQRENLRLRKILLRRGIDYDEEETEYS